MTPFLSETAAEESLLSLLPSMGHDTAHGSDLAPDWGGFGFSGLISRKQ